jgi:hypothetical protein
LLPVKIHSTLGSIEPVVILDQASDNELEVVQADAG